MVISSSIAIGLGLFFGFLFFAFVGELYYLFWYKKKIVRINNNSSNSSSSNNSGNINITTSINDGKGSSLERDVYNNNYIAQLYNLLCLKQKPSSPQNATAKTSDAEQQQGGQDDEDIEMQNPKSSPFVGVDEEESIESELMRLHNLSGPPRFLFTINEETKEDLIEFDRKSTSDANGVVVMSKMNSRNKSLKELLNESPLATPVASPLARLVPDSYNNPLFETATEAEVNKIIRCSPPPKFKFLRDAEEKLLRTLVVPRSQNHNHNHNHNQSQVLPLYASPRTSYS